MNQPAARFRTQQRLCLLALLALPFAALAQEQADWSLCPPVQSPLTASPWAEGDTAPSEQGTAISADQATARSDSLTTFSGQVVIQHRDKRLEAQQADYDKQRERIDLTGDVRLYTGNLNLQGERAHLELGRDSGAIEGARYYFPGSHAFGSAESIDFSSPQRTELVGARYTTCNPEAEAWVLKAQRMVLDEGENTGEAYHATLAFQGVPFLYLPYINFPLAGRKSGLLPPSIQVSEQNGTDISLPYYLNLAPHRDATLTARNMTARGAQLLSEFRYLNPASRGELHYDYLPDDKQTDSKRAYGSLLHEASLGHHWQLLLDYKEASDGAYFNDLDYSLGSASQTHLQRRLELSYQDPIWSFLTRIEDYQSLSGDETYQRLPQVRLGAHPAARPNRLNLGLDAEWVYFEHPGTQPTGSRLDLSPELSLPLQGAAWYLTPRLAGRHTQYDLEGGSGASEPSRSLPVASVDSGLFFERSHGEALTQTLEPRLYYLYVPYEDQDDIPVFDTGLNSFSFEQLFRDNRFSGADRVGDAHQLSAALSTRFLDDRSGTELFRASLGQISYFRNRTVTLDPATPTTKTASSALAAELAARPLKGLEFSASALWDPHQDRYDEVSSRLRYRPDKARNIGLSYRMKRETLELLRQSDLSTAWPLSRRWRFIGRWNYDLENEHDLETVAGLGYESCCWGARLVLRNRRDTVTDEMNASVYFVLEFKGLARLGRPIDNELERGILGY